MKNISNHEKRMFINWAIRNHTFKHRNVIWFFTSLLHDNNLLSNLHFVKEARSYSRFLIISTHLSPHEGFFYVHNDLRTEDYEIIMSDCVKHSNQPYFVQINFPFFQGIYKEYDAISEKNIHPRDDVYLKPEEREYIDSFLNQSIVSFQKQLLLKRIDEALDNRNEDLFILLTNILLQQKKDS